LAPTTSAAERTKANRQRGLKKNTRVDQNKPGCHLFAFSHNTCEFYIHGRDQHFPIMTAEFSESTLIRTRIIEVLGEEKSKK